MKKNEIIKKAKLLFEVAVISLDREQKTQAIRELGEVLMNGEISPREIGSSREELDRMLATAEFGVPEIPEESDKTPSPPIPF